MNREFVNGDSIQLQPVLANHFRPRAFHLPGLARFSTPQTFVMVMNCPRGHTFRGNLAKAIPISHPGAARQHSHVR
jgi:hypothetical protein